MRPGRITAVLLLLLGTPVGAAAQQIDIATDTELLAAYCIGALQTGLGTTLERARIERFRAYLAARGAFTTNRSNAASQGLNIAAERGHADGIACHRSRSAACEGADQCIADDLQFPF